MIPPVRCFTCGKPINNKYFEYTTQVSKILENSIDKETDKKNLFISLGIDRYCCRRMFTSHVELIKEIIKVPTDE